MPHNRMSLLVYTGEFFIILVVVGIKVNLEFIVGGRVLKIQHIFLQGFDKKNDFVNC